VEAAGTKVVFETEKYQLPAPLAEAPTGNTRVTLFAPRPLMSMDKADRVLAVYLHSCLQHVNRGFLTNSSVRRRFAIEQQNSAIASRLIRDALAAGAIVPQDATAAPKLMRYKPFWAAAVT
jgi:ATP-dependent DNA helicase RecG